MSDAREIIEAAIYAALGCTDTRKVDDFPQASTQIANFVLTELDRNGLCIAMKGARDIKFNPVGQKFGRLSITAELPRKLNRRGTPLRRWECKCDCGKTMRVMQSQISGKRPVQSCGCVRSEKIAKISRVHGFAGRIGRPPEYHVWQAMRRRCRNKNCEDYQYYGARGIDVCDRWNSFALFYADMGSRPSSGHSIDRIDVNKGYLPDNCRWATALEQRHNQRRKVAA